MTVILHTPSSTTDSPLRILQTENSPNWGGQEERLLRESLWLRMRGHTVAISCPPGSLLARRAREAGFDVFGNTMASTFSLPAQARALKTVLRFRPDVVQTHSPKDAWLFAFCRLRGIAVVRSRNISMPDRMSWFRGFAYRHKCHRVVAASQAIARDIIGKARVQPDRVDVIGSGVDLREFHPGHDGSAFRAEFGIPSGAVLFGVVAMLRGEKGQRFFVEAAIAAHREDPSLRFVIVGEATAGSDLESRLRGMIAEHFPGGGSPVILTGHRSDIPRVMAALNVLVVPSFHEAQTLVIPQAFATQRTVIASRVGGIPELVHDGETGLLVEPKNSAALAAAMLRMARDQALRARLAAAAFALAQRELSFDHKMEQLVTSFRRALTAARP